MHAMPIVKEQEREQGAERQRTEDRGQKTEVRAAEVRGQRDRGARIVDKLDRKGDWQGRVKNEGGLAYASGWD